MRLALLSPNQRRNALGGIEHAFQSSTDDYSCCCLPHHPRRYPATEPTATPGPALLDCPVVPTWCDPKTCSGIRSADEYHVVVDAKNNRITMLVTPHVTLEVPTPYPSPSAAPITPDTKNDISLSWLGPDQPNQMSRFVLWKDTLAIDVITTVDVATPTDPTTTKGAAKTTTDSTSPPKTTMTIAWHGTCSKAAKPALDSAPSPQ